MLGLHFRLLIALSVLVALATAAPASAAKQKRLEEYSATEEEGGQPPETRPLLMPSNGSAEDEQFAGPAAAPTTQAAPETAALEAPRPAETLVDSDSVPLPLPPPPYGAAPVAAQPNPALTVPVIPPPHEDVVLYDPVPASQKAAILKRIQLVDRMIAKYGRAYDYRTHTLRELRNIMAELDAAAKQQARR